MKTTDGKELKKNGYYYTRAGQLIILDDWAMGQNSPVFLVSSIYEGEAMEGFLYPSGHTEVSIDYEHPGEIEPVSEIFKDAPLFVVEENYKKKQEEILVLCQSIGSLNLSIKQSKEDLLALKARSKKAALEIGKKETHLEILESSIEVADKDLSIKLAKVSQAEDRFSDLTQTGDGAIICKDELESLRKDQFKLQCLEAGGVDNWLDFDDSLEDFR